MNKFKISAKIAGLLAAWLLINLSPVMAAPNIGNEPGGLTNKVGTGSGYSINTNQYTLSEMIGRVIKIILTFVGTIFFVLTVYAGFLWMTAQGNGEQVEKATGILRTATIGLIVVVAAYSITAFVMIFTARSTSF